MNWTAEQLELIARLGKMQYSAKQVAIALEVDEFDFSQEMEDVQSEAYKSYHKARILAELEIKELNYDMAKGGSPAAISQFLEQVHSLKTGE